MRQYVCTATTLYFDQWDDIDNVAKKMFTKKGSNMQKTKYSFFVLTSILLLFACNQEAALNGKVTNQDGEPLAGATISIKNTRFTTVSDSEGAYSLPYIPGQFEVTFDKEGYSSSMMMLNISDKTSYPVSDIVLLVINDTPEKLATAVFKSLVNNDEKEFVRNVFPNAEAIAAHLETMKNSTKGYELARLFKTPKYFQTKRNSTAVWAVDRKIAENFGINWDQVIFISSDVKVKSDKFLETVDVEFLIDSGGSLLYIQLRDCVLINGEWYMRGLLRVNPQRHHRN
jgi:hypothetical protein